MYPQVPDRLVRIAEDRVDKGRGVGELPGTVDFRVADVALGHGPGGVAKLLRIRVAPTESAARDARAITAATSMLARSRLSSRGPSGESSTMLSASDHALVISGGLPRMVSR